MSSPMDSEVCKSDMIKLRSEAAFDVRPLMTLVHTLSATLQGEY